MTPIYVLDSSALQTLNELAAHDATLTEKLTDLRDKSRVIYCEAAKNERQQYAKGEPVTIWAASGWRSLKEAAEVSFQTIQSVCVKFGKDSNQQDILIVDNEDTDEQQAIVTIALAQRLEETYDVIVVSNEGWTTEDRCTVAEACAFLGISCCTVEDFLDAEAIARVKIAH